MNVRDIRVVVVQEWEVSESNVQCELVVLLKTKCCAMEVRIEILFDQKESYDGCGSVAVRIISQ